MKKSKASNDIVFYIYDICFYLEGAVIVMSLWTSQLRSCYLKTISLDALKKSVRCLLLTIQCQISFQYFHKFQMKSDIWNIRDGIYRKFGPFSCEILIITYTSYEPMAELKETQIRGEKIKFPKYNLDKFSKFV